MSSGAPPPVINSCTSKDYSLTTEEGGQPVRWGILGTAKIALKWMAAIRKLPPSETKVIAIASRSLEKAQGESKNIYYFLFIYVISLLFILFIYVIYL